MPVLCLGAWEGPLDQPLDLARREKVDLARLSIAEMAEHVQPALPGGPGRPAGAALAGRGLAGHGVLAGAAAGTALPARPMRELPGRTLPQTARRGLWLADWLERRPQLGLDVLACGGPEPRQRTNGDADLLDFFRVCFELLALPVVGPYRPKTATLWRVPGSAILHVRGALRQAPEGARASPTCCPARPSEIPLRLGSGAVARWRAPSWPGLRSAICGEVALDQAAAFGEIRLRVAPAAVMQAAE